MTDPHPQPEPDSSEPTTFCCDICAAWCSTGDDPWGHERQGECQIYAPHVGEEAWPATKPTDWCLDGADITGWERVMIMGAWVWVPVIEDEDDD